MLPSVEDGMKRVVTDPNFGVFAGREKLVYDSIRMGQENFHINRDVFFTKYKGIVLRNGSPLRRTVDSVLLKLYDAGIINKITQVCATVMIFIPVTHSFAPSSG